MASVSAGDSTTDNKFFGNFPYRESAHFNPSSMHKCARQNACRLNKPVTMFHAKFLRQSLLLAELGSQVIIRADFRLWCMFLMSCSLQVSSPICSTIVQLT